ncbi:nucleotide disphospho-sugar-binding domain-containing protein [Streptacidiphilus albus]|uniref:nucleotide disphospho-sugar-binding domain-containing protein n=1 Tax=Streptacidiphilus albus TaxID=105425 RepID=UPI00054BC55A|nr:nucleotide disphospho-sugar-binding domain-containing protein [Streptacidiphilus albus]
MRVLMFNTPVPTHFTPLVPLAWALRAAGHEVLFAGQPEVVATARSAGLSGVVLGDWYHVGDMLTGGLRDGKRIIETRAPAKPEEMAAGAKVWMMHARYLLPEYLDFAREFKPDLILSDMLEYASLVVGGSLGVPVVHHRWGLDPISTGARGPARLALQGACHRLGLPGLPDPDLVLDSAPTALLAPGSEPGRPIRYVPFNGPGVYPEWLREKKPFGRRVVVSLGSRTLSLNGVPHVRDILSAFSGLSDTEAVATVEEEFREALGPMPENVRLIDPVPLHLIMESCDAVVHHGGAGTALTSTSFGLPQLVLPQLLDMFTTGQQLAAAGAAVCISDAEEQNDRSRLRAGLEAVLNEPGYARAAGDLARSMAGMPSPAEVVHDLEALARR